MQTEIITAGTSHKHILIHAAGIQCRQCVLIFFKFVVKHFVCIFPHRTILIFKESRKCCLCKRLIFSVDKHKAESLIEVNVREHAERIIGSLRSRSLKRKDAFFLFAQNIFFKAQKFFHINPVVFELIKRNPVSKFFFIDGLKFGFKKTQST